MPYFSNQELTDIVLLYGETRGNSAEARRLYAVRFPDREIPNRHTFQATVQHLRDHGTFAPQVHDRGRDRPPRIQYAEDQILNSIHNQPGCSTRRLGIQHQVSHMTVWRILHQQQLYPYHVQRVQCLQPGDPARRRAFCQWLLGKIAIQPNFLNFVLATDEAGFTREGVFNMHNTHVWADENPHAIREHNFQQEFAINAWAGIINGQLVGPHILPRRLNAVEYLDFLQHVLFDLLEDIPLEIRANLWYLQDGAPCHNAHIVRDWLNANFPGRWMGTYGPVAWPARSPDLNPCDFFLWGYMKQLVYAESVDSIEELRNRVENAAAIIRNNPAMLERVKESLIRRATCCLDNNGEHFEHLL